MNKSLSRPLVTVFAVFALLIAAALSMIPSAASNALPPAEMVDRAHNAAPEEGCELVQTLAYSRCGHTVVRRLTAPQELYGTALEEAQALYPDWQITEFAARQIKMEREFPLFCPDHLVLMPDAAGMLCVFENKYGDAMALSRELGIALSDLPAAAGEEAREGIGFATAEELEMWLESVES